MASEGFDDDVVFLTPLDQDPRINKLPEALFKEWKTRDDRFQTFDEFMKRIIRMGTLADVRFIFRGNQRIFGHKSILASKSDVLSTMFSERWSRDEIDEIDLTHSEISKEDFAVFMDFLYLGQVTVASPNVLALYHLADMYGIKELKRKCELYLREHIDADNVFTVLKSVLACDFERNSELLNDLLSFISRSGESMLDRREFQNFDQSNLELIFSREKFACAPLKILRFCMRWAVKNRGRSVYLNLDELNKFIQDTLKLRVRHDIPRAWHWNYTHCCVQPFHFTPDKEHQFTRFNSCSNTSGKIWTYRPNHPDRVSFRVSETIILTGIGFYGDARATCQCQNGETSMRLRSGALTGQSYNLEFKIYPHGQPHKQLAYFNSKAGTDVDNSSDRTFKLGLNYRKPLYIYPNEWYTLHSSMMGPRSYYGQEGAAEKLVICGGIPFVFEFKEAESSKDEVKTSNPTGVPIGQFPAIYFKIPQSVDDDDVQLLDSDQE